MTYYMFSIKWSQTDHDKVIIEAETKEMAQEYADYIWSEARYRECQGTAQKLHTVTAVDMAEIKTRKAG